MKQNRLIISAASSGYEQSLLALIGSLNCNWPDHPPILVYDLGMSSYTLNLLDTYNIEWRSVPPFVPHWREDYTWKFWCFNDAPACTYLWLDAGLCVLRPLEEAFVCAESLGYFAVSLYNHPILPSVPRPLLSNLKIDASHANEMISISSGIHSIRKEGRGECLVDEAYKLCLDHPNLRATDPRHRHDQALLTLLLYKYFGAVVLADYHIYAHHYPTGPGEETRQKIWVHRRKMIHKDVEYFVSKLSCIGDSYLPTDYIRTVRPTVLMRLRILLAKFRGRYPSASPINDSCAIPHGIKD